MLPLTTVTSLESKSATGLLNVTVIGIGEVRVGFGAVVLSVMPSAAVSIIQA